jgi:hypothetical protein
VYEELGGNPFFFDTIDKFYSSNDFCQALWVVESNPPLLRTLTKFKSHRDYALH